MKMQWTSLGSEFPKFLLLNELFPLRRYAVQRDTRCRGEVS
jgi:hypothetical protein